jgi:hypothetical protein
MLIWLKTWRGVHVETLLASIGALAGFSAQIDVWRRIQARDIPKIVNAASLSPEALTQQLRSAGLFVEVRTKSGERLYFGDMINGYLVPLGMVDIDLWAIVAGAARSAGVPQSDLPDYRAMFKQVATTVGSAEFGVPTVAKEHQPQLKPREALNLLWPRVRFIFNRTDGPGPAKGRSVPPPHRAFGVAFVAHQLLLMSKDTLNPRIGLRLVMESAIAMSKIDPKTVPQDAPAKK